jgi:site-specific recombinase XerD
MKDKYIENWLHGLSERTKTNYLTEIEKWLQFIKMSPREQIEKRASDLASSDLTQRTYFENKFREYKEYLEKNTNLSASSIKTMLRTVASFFSRNGLTLVLKSGDWQSTRETEVIHKFKLSNEDIKKMYAHGNLRDRSLLLTLYQSGFSEIDVSELKVENIEGIYELPENEHYFIEKPREKSGIIQATCLSYEALHDIRAMLTERGKPSEGFIFTSQTFGKGKKIETRTINEAMKSLAEKAFGKEKAREFKTKALRSAYNSALLRADIKSEVKDLMMGHVRQSARKHYDYDSETIKEAYSKAFDFLTVNGIQARQDATKLKEEIEGLKTVNANLQRQLNDTNKTIEGLQAMIREVLIKEGKIKPQA